MISKQIAKAEKVLKEIEGHNPARTYYCEQSDCLHCPIQDAGCSETSTEPLYRKELLKDFLFSQGLSYQGSYVTMTIEEHKELHNTIEKLERKLDREERKSETFHENTLKWIKECDRKEALIKNYQRMYCNDFDSMEQEIERLKELNKELQEKVDIASIVQFEKRLNELPFDLIRSILKDKKLSIQVDGHSLTTPSDYGIKEYLRELREKMIIEGLEEYTDGIFEITENTINITYTW